MGTATSSCRVEETLSSHYEHATVLEENVNGSESLRLYRITALRFEAVLYNPEKSPNCFSLFRSSDEEDARKKFRYVILYASLIAFVCMNTVRCDLLPLQGLSVAFIV